MREVAGRRQWRASCPRSECGAVKIAQPLVSAGRVAGGDDHDRQPAVCLDAVRQPDADGTGWKLSDIQWAFTLFILFQTWVQPLRRAGSSIAWGRACSSRRRACCAGSAGPGSAIATTLPMLYALYVLAGIGAALVYSGSHRVGAEMVHASGAGSRRASWRPASAAARRSSSRSSRR